MLILYCNAFYLCKAIAVLCLPVVVVFNLAKDGLIGVLVSTNKLYVGHRIVMGNSSSFVLIL